MTSTAGFTKGPWRLSALGFAANDGAVPVLSGDPNPSADDAKRITMVDCQTKFKRGEGHKATCAERDANARLIAAAPDLYEAARLLEAAELAHANCPECDGGIMPELCERCFPDFDEARIKRREALSKAVKP